MESMVKKLQGYGLHMDFKVLEVIRIDYVQDLQGYRNHECKR
jgi:hypothetical protein